MATTVTRVPTQRGDVLILRTDVSFRIHAIGKVTQDGQQDLHAEVNLHHEVSLEAAIARAKALSTPGHRIYLRDLDAGTWSEVA